MFELGINFPSAKYKACYEDIKSSIFLLRNVQNIVLSGNLYHMVGEEFNEEFCVTRTAPHYPEVILIRKTR